MFAMTSWCFDGLLQCAATALCLSKPNPACARHQVSETGASVPLAWHHEVPRELPPTGSHGDSVCASPGLPPLVFRRKIREIVDRPGAESSHPMWAVSTPSKAAARPAAMDVTGDQFLEKRAQLLGEWSGLISSFLVVCGRK